MRLRLHPRLTHDGQRHTIDEHLPPQHVAYKMRGPQWCLKQAEVVGLAKRYGAVRLEAACQRALHFDNIQYRAVRVILEKSLDQQSDPQQCFDEMSDAYTGAARFGRDTRKLFTKH